MKRPPKSVKNKKNIDPATRVTSTPEPVVDYRKTLPFYLLSGIIAFVLYINTYNHQYALDDAMMITQNRVTQQGFAGIKDHLTHDFLYGFLPPGAAKNAGSSRWRPLPLITFGLEVGIWGINHPNISHLINILLYTVLILLLLHFLNVYLLKNIWLAFFATLLYCIHPLHSEVVSNIKSRDEILSLLFLLWSLIEFMKFTRIGSNVHYVISLVLFFISLTAKENPVTFIIGIPLILYFFTDLKRNKIIKYGSSYLLTVLVFMAIRISLVPISDVKPADEIMNNPFLYATGLQSFLTKIYILLLYIKLILIPYPLVYDYSYRMIPYQDISSPGVWLSVLFYTGIFIYALNGFKSKNIFSFCILMFLLTISVSSNIIVEIGLTMGDRMMFLPTIFTSIIFALAGNKIADYLSVKLKMKKIIPVAIMITPVFLLSAGYTFARNKDWKNDVTLQIADVKYSDNSVRTNGGAGNAYITLAENVNNTKQQKDSLINLALKYFRRALVLNPGYNDAYLNMGVAYTRIDSIEKAEEYWNHARTIFREHPKIKEFDDFLAIYYRDKAFNYESKGSNDSAVMYYRHALKYMYANDTIHQETLFHLAGTFYRQEKYQESHDVLGELLQLNPDNEKVKIGFNATAAMLNSKK